MAKIKDVARRAGVSVSTVSNVLSGKKYVSEALSIRVMDAVNELGYQADPIAQMLKTSKSYTVGIVSTEIGGVFFPSVLKGLYDILRKNGYNLQVFEADGRDDHHKTWERVLEGVRNFVDYHVDGIVLTMMLPMDMEEVYIHKILKMTRKNRRIPIVCLNGDCTCFGIDSVYDNQYKGATKAVSYLIEKGCTNIAHITGPIYTHSSTDRLKGYRDAMDKAGLVVNEDQIAYGDYTHQAGYKCMKEIIQKAPGFDGVFGSNDMICFGAMRALREAGYRIPEDVKVIGYDNTFICDMLETPLSTIDVQKHLMGERAGELLIEQMNREDSDGYEAVAFELEGRLIERKSTFIDAMPNGFDSEW